MVFDVKRPRGAQIEGGDYGGRGGPSVNYSEEAEDYQQHSRSFQPKHGGFTALHESPGLPQPFQPHAGQQQPFALAGAGQRNFRSPAMFRESERYGNKMEPQANGYRGAEMSHYDGQRSGRGPKPPFGGPSNPGVKEPWTGSSAPVQRQMSKSNMDWMELLRQVNATSKDALPEEEPAPAPYVPAGKSLKVPGNDVADAGKKATPEPPSLGTEVRKAKTKLPSPKASELESSEEEMQPAHVVPPSGKKLRDEKKKEPAVNGTSERKAVGTSAAKPASEGPQPSVTPLKEKKAQAAKKAQPDKLEKKTLQGKKCESEKEEAAPRHENGVHSAVHFEMASMLPLFGQADIGQLSVIVGTLSNSYRGIADGLAMLQTLIKSKQQ